MRDTYLLFSLWLMMTLLFGLVRVVRGPQAVDRMLAAQLLGTGGVALLLLLSLVLNDTWLLDVALVSALLAAFAGVAFVRLGGSSR